jgi:hypothetical protein
MTKQHGQLGVSWRPSSLSTTTYRWRHATEGEPVASALDANDQATPISWTSGRFHRAAPIFHRLAAAAAMAAIGSAFTFVFKVLPQVIRH